MKNYRKILAHPILLLTGSRYFCYALNFLRGFLIAKILGPYYFGIWGAVTLALQYLSFTSIGVENSLTILLSTDSKVTEKEEGNYASVSVTLIALIGGILLLAGYGLNSAGITLFGKFDLNKYLLPILGITLLSNAQQILTNIYRVKNGLRKIALAETGTAIILLAILFFYRSSNLIDATLSGMIVTSLLSILYYCYRIPIRLAIKIDTGIVSKLVQIGFPLLIYNFSFYLILASGRTLLGIFYSVEELGYYTLANSIASATFLGLKTVGWSIYPKVLARFKPENDLDQVKHDLQRLNRFYSTSVLLVVLTLILFMPAALYFLPQFRAATATITILLLTQAVLSMPFGYNTLAVSRNYQGKVAKISVTAVALVFVLCVLVSVFRLEYKFIAVSVMAGSILFAYRQIRMSNHILDIKKNGSEDYEGIFSVWNVLSMCIVLAGAFTNHALFWNLAGMIVFLAGNFKNLRQIYSLRALVLK